MINYSYHNSEEEKKNKIRIRNRNNIQSLREEHSENPKHESLSIFEKYHHHFLLKFIKTLNECGYLPKISRDEASRKDLTLGYINKHFEQFMLFWNQLDWEAMKQNS